MTAIGQSTVVSVVIPTYNHAQFLRSALNSVIGQTFDQWEVIVVNNFSQDDTVSVIESYDDSRIRYVNFANQGVIAASRNHGIKKTVAPYIAFLDSDDIWYAQKLEKCMSRIQQGFDMVCHAETWVGPGDRRRDVVYGPESRATYSQLLYEGNCISTSAVVVKREFMERVGGFSEETSFVTAEDYELWLKLAREGARIGFIPDILGEYLIHDGNQSRAALRNMEAVMSVVRHHLAGQASRGESETLRTRRCLALIYYSGARGLQDSGQFKAAWRYFLKAVALYPLIPKFYAAMLLNACGHRP
jgi:glycosyltransferase involved in cell wall biosynthesis